jgi:hypothetical protein
VSLARTFSLPVGMTSVSPGNASDRAARRLAKLGDSGRGVTGSASSRQPPRMNSRNASGKSGSCDSVFACGAVAFGWVSPCSAMVALPSSAVVPDVTA